MFGRKGIRPCWSVGLVMLAGASLLAGYPPKTELREACADTEIIVVGQVAWAKSTGRETTREKYGRQLKFSVRRADLVVKQVVRGKIQHDRIMVEFLGVPGLGGGFTGSGDYFRLEKLVPGEMHVVFLRDRQEGEDCYRLVNDYQSVIHIRDSAAVSRLLATGPEQQDAESYVASLLATSLPELSSYFKMVPSLEDLVSLRGKQSVATLKEVLDRSQDPRIKGWILGMLLRLEDHSSVQRAVEFLAEDDDSDKAVVDAKRGVSTWLMCVKDKPTVEKYIVPLLKNPSGSVRCDAARAIKRAKCARALPDLIAGLEDTDQHVRHQCLRGLAKTMDRGGHWGPGMELFEKDEQKYIKRWQDWWEKEGRELSAKLRQGKISTFPRPARARHPRLPANAPEMSLREVCAGSETIVVGKVVSEQPGGRRTTFLRDGKRTTFSGRRVGVAVERVLKGRTQDDTIVVELLGVLEAGLLRVGETPEKLVPGENTVLFLNEPRDGEDWYTLTNYYHSVIRIGDSGAVARLLGKIPEQQDVETCIESLLIASLAELKPSSSEFRDSLDDFISLRGRVPGLIVGLEEADQEVRYQCLMGLAETLGRGGEWAPRKSAFLKDEKSYIKRWQDWWKQEGRKKHANSRDQE